MRFLLRLLITAAALWVATKVVSGIHYSGSTLALLGVALVFGVVNAIIRPIVKLFSFPIIIVTLGLFTLIINAFMLWLTSAFAGTLGLGFHVDGFKAAFLGALVVSIVSFVGSMLLSAKVDRTSDDE